MTTTHALMHDATAAARDGLLPERLSRFLLAVFDVVDGPEQYEAMEAETEAYVVAHNLVGYANRALAEHGLVDHCPEWCQSEHDPVTLVHPADIEDARSHLAYRAEVESSVGRAVSVSVEVGMADDGGRAAPLVVIGLGDLSVLTIDQAETLAVALTGALKRAREVTSAG